MTNKNKRLSGIFIVGCLLAVGVAVAAELASSGIFGSKHTICEGVKISKVEVGGMTKAEAENAVDDHIAGLLSRKVVIQIGENELETDFESLGMHFSEEKLIDQAYAVGKKGNLIKRMREVENAHQSGKTFALKYSFDEQKLKEYVEKECTQFDVKAKNSKLSLKNGRFVASKERTGRELQVDQTIDRIRKTLQESDQSDSYTVQAIVETTEPKYTQEMVSKCQDLLGRYSTSYATSTAARATNVQTAAGRINGTILYPGKTFSTIKVIKERTEANGYKSASEYSSGKVVDGVGGGVCQVSTTLYNAVINAELEVVERSPHSMVVSYVDVSRDAAIAGDYKDFKFKNNTNAPVYIAASAEGGVLSFRIYGEETRESGREISFESEILETIQPGDDEETVDETKPASYREVTQSAHVGYKAKLWKIIKVNGKQTDKVQLNSSSYAAEPRHVTVGAGAAGSPKPSASADPKATKDPKATGKPKSSKEPKKTAKPKSTKKPAKNATAKPKATAAAKKITKPVTEE